MDYRGSASLAVSLAIAIYGVIESVQKNGPPKIMSMELEWVGENRAVFLMAASIFGTQSFVSVVLIYILKNMKELAECWGTKFSNMLSVYCLMSFVGCVMYLCKYLYPSHVVIVVDGLGEYLFMRNLHWMVSTPTQWFVYSQVCTKATPEDMVPVYSYTCLMHVFGVLMLIIGNAKLRWFCMFVGCYYFALYFYLVFQLPLRKDMAVVGARLRLATLVVWTGFPVAVFLRWLGFVGPWSEQVLMFSVLDVVTKSVTFSAIIVSRVVLSLAKINGTVQLVLSSHDVTLTINDNWQLLDDSSSGGVIASYFGGSAEHTRLVDFCINEEHQQRLIEAARKADSQNLGSPTPKVVVAFRFPGGGGETLAECLVSKCLHGRRIIGIAVASQSGGPNLQGGAAVQEWTEQAPSEISLSSTQSTRNIDVQMKLALHNCTDVLQLSEPMRRILTAMFMQQHSACAIFAWEDAGMTPAIVVASPRLQALFFQGSHMPQPLSALTAPPMVERLLLALQAEDVLVHQWSHVQSPTGMSFELTMLPLTGTSCMAISNCQVQLCVLVVVLADSTASGPPQAQQRPGYLAWRANGYDLRCDCDSTGKARDLSPPRVLMPLVTAHMECLR